eukprot:6190335-Pleurochrysis_carterae.AAC.4
MRCAFLLWLIPSAPASRRASKCGTEMVFDPAEHKSPVFCGPEVVEYFSARVAVNQRVVSKDQA